MKFLVTFTLIVLTNMCFGQGVIVFNKVSKNDSVNLIKTMRKYINAVENKDKKVIKKLSLNIVDCDMCITDQGFDNPIEDAFVNTDIFEAYLFDSLSSSHLWESIQSGNPIMTSTSTSPNENYHPKSVKLREGEYFIGFELGYIINSSTDKYYFRFIKVENEFKLWGVRVSPY